jgi:hypothetical protein
MSALFCVTDVYLLQTKYSTVVSVIIRTACSKNVAELRDRFDVFDEPNHKQVVQLLSLVRD